MTNEVMSAIGPVILPELPDPTPEMSAEEINNSYIHRGRNEAYGVGKNTPIYKSYSKIHPPIPGEMGGGSWVS